MLTVSNITKTFHLHGKSAVKDVSFTVPQGQFLCLLGPSGCGKSTLLRIIAGLLVKYNGKITWEKSVRLGFVFQHFALFPYLRVWENIAFGLKMRGVSEKEQYKIVESLLKEIGLSEVAMKYPRELSGGMRQRVGIARALAIDPDVLLLDEPFSALDEFTAEKLRTLLLEVWQKRKMTVIMVTHLIREAVELSDRIIVMTPAPGKVEADLDVTLARPRNLRSQACFTLEDKLQSIIRV
jgi:NitT/TauT family transport system ATP-binding protein